MAVVLNLVAWWCMAALVVGATWIAVKWLDRRFARKGD